MEIAEDEEEDRRQSTVMEERASTIKAPSIGGYSDHPLSDLPSPETPELLTSMTYQSFDTEPTTEPDSEALDLTPSISIDPSIYSMTDYPSDSPRQSLEQGRPSLQETRSEHGYQSYPTHGRPKVKLGPRPSIEGQPQTSSTNYRPVSTLPAGLKLFSRSSKRPKERPPPSMTVSPPMLDETMEEELVRPHTSGGRPTTSSGVSFKSAISTNTVTLKKPAMTPEKARLMKALELRKKKMNAPQRELLVPIPPLDGIVQESIEAESAPAITADNVESKVASQSSLVEDSGTTIESSFIPSTTESDAIANSSTPASPITLSEPEESTRASSISDSTDETIQVFEDNIKIVIVHDAIPDADATSPHESQDTNHFEQRIPLEKSEPAEAVTPHEEIAESRRTSIAASEISSLLEPEQPISLISDVSEDSQEIQQQAPAEIPDVSEDSQEIQQQAPVDIPDVSEDSQKIQQQAPVDILDVSEDSQEIQQQAPVGIPDVSKYSQNIQQQAPVEIPDVSEYLQNIQQQAPVEIPNVQMEDVSIADSGPELQVNGLATTEEVPQDEPSAVNEGLLTELPTLPEPAQTDKDDIKIVDSEALVETPLAEAKTTAREMKIPRSKFSVQDLKADDASDSNAGIDASKLTDHTSPKKRRTLMEPIHTDLHLNQSSRPASEFDLFNDDDLMDELQSATVEEAKPMSVAKSPMNSVFPREVKAPSVSDRFSRAFSNPLKKDNQHLLPQKSEPSRSVSASAYLNRINRQQSAAPAIKKVNLGSGISQRIKALERLSSIGPVATPPPSAGATACPSPTFFAVRKSPAAGSSKAPSIADRANSLTRHTPSPSNSHESSPEQLKNRDRSFSIKSRKDAFNSSPTSAPARARPESISVTARILRDPAQPFPSKPDIGKDPSSYGPLVLKQSPLIIDHQTAVAPEPMKETIQETRLTNSPNAAKERRSSITVVKDLINDTRNSFAERRKSTTVEPNPISGATRSPSRPPSTHQGSSGMGRPSSVSSRRSSRDYSNALTPSSSSILSASTIEENVEKKGSRASRMLHRMSTSLSSSRKTLTHAMSPTTVREESEPPSTGVSMSPSNMSVMSSSASTMVEMGDVNVQFPDNLLWKRRAMRLDSQGFLFLTQLQAGKTTERSAGVKKYHLSDFRAPAIPDMEAEELPNSVVLDFIDGAGLQLACEDRGGQLWVLQSESPIFLTSRQHQY